MSNSQNFRPFSSFRGLRRVPLVAVSLNSINPELSITDEGAAFRVIRRHFIRFTDLDRVDLAWRLAHQVTFIPREGPWTFSFNYLEKNSPRTLLRELARRGVTLTHRAQDFLQ